MQEANHKTSRIVAYVGLTVLMLFAALELRNSTWIGSTEIHTLMEVAATVLAFVIGVIALLHYYTTKNVIFLFIGAGFISAGFLDGYHGVVTSVWFSYLFPSPPPSLLPWSWMASRLALSLSMFLSWYAWYRERERNKNPLSPSFVYAFFGLLTLVLFTVFVFVPLPRAYYPELLFGRPGELIPAFFFFLALVGYLVKGMWQKEQFEHWLVMSLIVGFSSQAMFMSSSSHLFDGEFDVAHLLKKMSYIFVLTGLLISMYKVFKRERDARETLAQQATILESEKRSREEVLRKLTKNELQMRESVDELSDTRDAMLNLLEDIKEEKKRTEVLAKDLEKFKLAVENVSDAVVITDHKAEVLYVNEATVQMTGYSMKKIIGSKCGSLWGGYMSKEFYDKMWSILTEEKAVFEGELLNKRKNDTDLRAKTSIAPILNNKGEIVFFVELMRDVTEEYRQKQELQKFQLAVEDASDHIVITDAEGIVLYANSAVTRVTGFQREEILGTKAGKLWGGLMEPEFYEELWNQVKKKKQPFSGTIKNKRKNGDVYYAASTISPILDNEGEVGFFVAIERDITKEKEIDQAKTEFVSLASHQLRTPLSTVNWYAEMLLAGDVGELSEDQHKYLEEIYAGNQRMVELVNALLNVSRLELGTFMVEPELTNMVELARSVMDEQKPQIDERQLTLTPKLDEDLPKILVDPKLMRMVFQNLLSNAVKYTPLGGRIELSVTKDADNKNVNITVADSGLGIPEDEKSKIFSKLFRATNVRESDTDGTGLGLYIVKSVVEHTGGTIRFESQENKGTTFFVTLPLSGMKKKQGTKVLDE